MDDLLPLLIHDFRTPLASILLHLELLQGGGGLSAEDAEDVRYALASARLLSEMMSVTQELHRLSAEATALESTEVDLPAAVHDAVGALELLAVRGEIRIDAPEELRVLAHPDSLRRVVQQLAWAATSVSSSEDVVRIVVRPDPDRARLEVHDRGQRIPADLASAMLDPGAIAEVRERSGALSRGIGPAYCRLAIGAQGGRVGISAPEDAPDERGNVFWLDLPRAPG